MVQLHLVRNSKKMSFTPTISNPSTHIHQTCDSRFPYTNIQIEKSTQTFSISKLFLTNSLSTFNPNSKKVNKLQLLTSYPN